MFGTRNFLLTTKTSVCSKKNSFYQTLLDTQILKNSNMKRTDFENVLHNIYIYIE